MRSLRFCSSAAARRASRSSLAATASSLSSSGSGAMNSGIAPMGVRERSSCSFSRCRSLMVLTGSGATSGSSTAGSSVADSSAATVASAGCSAAASSAFCSAASAAASVFSAACAGVTTSTLAVSSFTSTADSSDSAAGATTSSTFAVFSTVSTFAVFSTVSTFAVFSTVSTFAVFSTVSTFAVFSTTAGSAAFFSAASNRLSRVEATSVSDTTGAATFGAGACLALALRRLVRPAAIASSRGTSGAFSFFGRPGRRRSVPCWASELSRTFLRRVSRVSAEAFFSSARAFNASKTPSSTFFSSDINLLSLHPAPHRKDFNSAHTAQSLVAATAAQASPYGAHSSALPGTISFSASAVGGERAERRARRDGHSHLALEHGTLTPFLGALPVFGFLRRGGRPARCDSYAPRLIAGALRVLSLDALVGIFMRVRGAQDTVFHYTR